jgi:hypothetical protein
MTPPLLRPPRDALDIILAAAAVASFAMLIALVQGVLS